MRIRTFIQKLNQNEIKDFDEFLSFVYPMSFRSELVKRGIRVEDALALNESEPILEAILQGYVPEKYSEWMTHPHEDVREALAKAGLAVLNQVETRHQNLKQKLQNPKQKLQSLKQTHQNLKQKHQNLKRKLQSLKRKHQNQVGHHRYQISTPETSTETLGHNRLHNPLTARGRIICYCGTPYSIITVRAIQLYITQTL